VYRARDEEGSNDGSGHSEEVAACDDTEPPVEGAFRIDDLVADDARDLIGKQSLIEPLGSLVELHASSAKVEMTGE
jgi:hypothetical protein